MKQFLLKMQSEPFERVKVRESRKPRCGFVIGLLMFSALPAFGQNAFETWKTSFMRYAVKQGVSKSVVDQALKDVKLDAEVIRLANHQPEFTKTIGNYITGATSENRIKTGQKLLSKYRAYLDHIERTFGVDRHVIVAIWGMESSYGGVLEQKSIKNAVPALVTLAYKGGRLQNYGYTQLIGALKIVERGDMPIHDLKGSWAGAIGHTQFIPTTFLEYAVDFDGDKKRNLTQSKLDALASTANYLSKKGWEKGKTWGYEVVLPKKFQYSLADGARKKTIRTWQSLGIKRTRGRAFPRPDDTAFLIVPSGASGPAFLMLNNFAVIKRYNNATSYALAVGHLADRLRGGGTFSKSWPKQAKALSLQDKKDLQRLLKQKGYAVGKVDGRIGPKTQSAIRAFQIARGLTADGFASYALLRTLKNL